MIETDHIDSLKEQYRLVAQNEYAFALVDKNPSARGHIIVLPKRIVRNLDDCTAKEAKAIFNLIDIAQAALTKWAGMDCIVAKNFGNFITVDHIHFHVFTSEKSIGKLLSTPESYKQKKSKKEIEQMAQAIKDNL